MAPKETRVSPNYGTYEHSVFVKSALPNVIKLKIWRRDHTRLFELGPTHQGKSPSKRRHRRELHGEEVRPWRWRRQAGRDGQERGKGQNLPSSVRKACGPTDIRLGLSIPGTESKDLYGV